MEREAEDGGPFRCFSCGRLTHEVKGGPLPEEVYQAYRWITGVLDVDDRAAVLCWVCFWKTEPDMWINEEIYAELNPVVPFAKLPKLLPWDESFKHEDPASYPWPLE